MTAELLLNTGSHASAAAVAGGEPPLLDHTSDALRDVAGTVNQLSDKIYRLAFAVGMTRKTNAHLFDHISEMSNTDKLNAIAERLACLFDEVGIIQQNFRKSGEEPLIMPDFLIKDALNKNYTDEKRLEAMRQALQGMSIDIKFLDSLIFGIVYRQREGLESQQEKINVLEKAIDHAEEAVQAGKQNLEAINRKTSRIKLVGKFLGLLLFSVIVSLTTVMLLGQLLCWTIGVAAVVILFFTCIYLFCH